MRAERLARFFVFGLALGLPLAVLLARWLPAPQPVELHGRMAESGGWAPSDLTAVAGEPLHLRMTSDDVVHGFAVGGMDWPSLDVEPGKVTETTLVFVQPGKYVYYCTRWCGLSHWRMRGTIQVEPRPGEAADTAVEAQASPEPPLYVTLGLDLDAPHPAGALPSGRPSAQRGASLSPSLPPQYRTQQYQRTRSPSAAWEELRRDPFTQDLSDEQVWDLVAWIWSAGTSSERLAEGKTLYAQNCAACHGESGAGDGVMAQAGQTPAAPQADHDGMGEMPPGSQPIDGHTFAPPAAFSDPATMLGASPALLHGKIVRGGMGTGMPYWGPIFTGEQVWALVDYLWTFQLDLENK